jgi:hypothetical protein
MVNYTSTSKSQGATMLNNKLVNPNGTMVDAHASDSMKYYAVAKCEPKRLDQMVARFMRHMGYSLTYPTFN